MTDSQDQGGGRARARSRQRRAVERVRDTGFPIVMRGYDRQRVDRYVAEVAELVAELEANQLSDTVVQRALEEVGDQTSGILQRARETAGEIEAQAWAKAEATVQGAEREGEVTRREAERYAEQLANDTRALWEERQRLIEEMRQLADEVLGVADDALDRLQAPGTDLVEPEYEDDTTAEHPGRYGFGDDETLGDDGTLDEDDTTAAEEGVFADGARPGPDEPSPDEPSAADQLSAEEPPPEDPAAAEQQRNGSAEAGNGAGEADADVTAVFERPPAERPSD